MAKLNLELYLCDETNIQSCGLIVKIELLLQRKVLIH